MHLRRLFMLSLVISLARGFGVFWHLKKLHLQMKHIIPLLMLGHVNRPKLIPFPIIIPAPSFGSDKWKQPPDHWQPYEKLVIVKRRRHHYLDDLYSHHDLELDEWHSNPKQIRIIGDEVDHHHHHHHHHTLGWNPYKKPALSSLDFLRGGYDTIFGGSSPEKKVTRDPRKDFVNIKDWKPKGAKGKPKTTKSEN